MAKPGAAPTKLLHTLATGECLTVTDLIKELSLNRRQVVDAAAKLLARGYLERMGTGCYQLTETGLEAAREGIVITSGPKGPTGTIPRHSGTFRERAWRAMRVRHRFTIGEIVADAGRGDPAADRQNATRYIRYLRAAGYVGELPRRVPGTAIGSNGFKRFVLINNTGPRAPVYRGEAKAIHDFNLGKDIPCTKN